MRTIFGILALFVLSFPVAANTARCSLSQTGDCLIRWDFSAQPRVYYWIQQYNVAIGQWVNLEGPFIEPNGTGKSTVPGGFLYRVLGCDDSAGRTMCESSTVYWAPIRVESAAAIPAKVKNPRGGTFTVDKTGSLETQLLQYNVYRIAQTVEGIGDLSSFPPMTVPPSEDDVSHWTDADWVHDNVYPNYEIVRKMHIAANEAVEQGSD